MAVNNASDNCSNKTNIHDLYEQNMQFIVKRIIHKQLYYIRSSIEIDNCQQCSQ